MQRLLVPLLLLPALTLAALPRLHDDQPEDRVHQLLEDGRRAFRDDTFGDEAFWSEALGLHRSIAGIEHGGIGPGLAARTALALGLQVDLDRLDGRTRSDLRHGRVDLDAAATTLALLRQDAVVGVRGQFDAQGRLAAVGITCALCHSTVDDALAPGIGHRRDGWPNRSLDVGSILAFAPNLQPIAQALQTTPEVVRSVLASWGPGKFDAHLLLDGQAFRPDGRSAAVLIPAAFGLGGVDRATYEGWGGIAHWNAFVGNLEMGGQGTLFDPRLDDAVKYPVAASTNAGHTHAAVDRITGQLAALQIYQLSLPVPLAPAGSFDPQAATRGESLFTGQAGCARCHVPPIYCEPGFPMHTAAELGIDDFQSRRGPYDRYRTTPLRGLQAKARGGYYHDGRFADLAAVVAHYDSAFQLGLSELQRQDLVEFLKTL